MNSPMRIRAKYLVFLVFFFFPGFGHAHPHVFVDSSFTLIGNGSSIEGVRVKWVFDEMFTATITQSFDHDGTFTFNANEKESVELGAFINLRNHDFFSYIEVNGSEQIVTEYEDFDTYLESGRVVYEFTLPLDLQMPDSPLVLRFGNFDDSYYTDIIYTDNPYELRLGTGLTASVVREPEPSLAYYGGTIVPELFEITIRRN
ncbi:MAG: DUF1007 family protein [Spirochaetia bacterium]